MISILTNQFVCYLKNRKQNFALLDSTGLIVKFEITTDSHFDIIDRSTKIIQDLGTGSATYHNPIFKEITFIDYENFMNQLPKNLQKGIKRCDFIAYDKEMSFFILNELSQSKDSQSKMSDAIEQLHATAMHLCKSPGIKDFIDKYPVKKCILSNKHKLISSPENIADAFNLIQKYLPEPIIQPNYRINKLGFELIETAIIYV